MSYTSSKEYEMIDKLKVTKITPLNNESKEFNIPYARFLIVARGEMHCTYGFTDCIHIDITPVFGVKGIRGKKVIKNKAHVITSEILYFANKKAMRDLIEELEQNISNKESVNNVIYLKLNRFELNLFDRILNYYEEKSLHKLLDDKEKISFKNLGDKINEKLKKV
jgi:hypothetical protein